MNKSNYIICSILCFLVVMLSLNTLFNSHFAQSERLISELNHYKQEYQRTQLALEVQTIKQLEFQQEVARVLPEFSFEPQDYLGRQLASVTKNKENPKLFLGLSEQMLKKGKEYFKKKDYKNAKSIFENYVQKYPLSLHIPEVSLMLVEINFVEKKYEQSMKQIEILIKTYPSNEVSAHALFIFAEIMKINDRLEDATDMYKLIIEAFPVKQFRRRAKREMASIGFD